MTSIFRTAVFSSLFKNPTYHGLLHHNNTRIITRTLITMKGMQVMQVGPKLLAHYRKIDKVTNDFELVYFNKPAWSPLIWGHLSKLVGIAMIGFSYVFLQQDVTEIDILEKSIARTKGQVVWFLAFAILISFAVSAVSLKIAHRIYYSAKKKKFRIYSMSRIPFKTHVNEFEEGKMVRRKFSWYRFIRIGEEYTANKRHYIFDNRKFKSPMFRTMLIGELDNSITNEADDL